MKINVLNCYKDFKCKAGGCKHNCCLKWEIDIDKKSLKKYKSLEKKGKIESGKIDYKSGRFIMQNGRCPFLEKDSLCHLIKNFGSSILCKTCTLHPRFRNFYSFGVEEGIGLCCEEGVKMLLDFNGKIEIQGEKPNKREWFVSKRKEILSQIESAESFNVAIINLFTDMGIEKDIFLKCNLKEFLCSLEILSDEYKSFISSVNFKPFDFSESDLYKKLFSLCLYRHVSSVLDERDFISKLLYSVLIIYVIQSLISESGKDGLDIVDIVVTVSSELEYSDINEQKILDFLDGLQNLKYLK